jgi:hypothetical protein
MYEYTSPIQPKATILFCIKEKFIWNMRVLGETLFFRKVSPFAAQHSDLLSSERELIRRKTVMRRSGAIRFAIAPYFIAAVKAGS